MNRPLLLLVLTMLFLRPVQPADKNNRGSGGKARQSSDINADGVSWAKHVLQGYNMRIWLSNQIAFGIEAWSPLPVPPSGNCGPTGIGLEYPLGGCVEHMFGGGPWIGGIIDGKRRVDETYNGDDARHEIVPALRDTARDKIWHTHTGIETDDPNDLNGHYSGYYARHGIQVNRRGCDDDQDGRVDEDELDGEDNDGDWNPLTDDLGSDGLPDSQEVSCTGKVYDPVTNPDPAFDNYDRFAFDKCHTDAGGNYIRKSDKNLYTQNNGIPDHGEPHVDEDYGAISDKDYYMGATDSTGTCNGCPDHVPMHIKCFMKSYAWEGDFADGVLPFDYIFVNVGRKTIKDVYVAFFCDMDVGPVNISGYYGHDYACYFPDLRTAYIHNAVDRGSTPMGLTVLKTPRPLDSLQYIFQWHGFNEPGTEDSLIYCWMSGQCFVDPIKPCQSPISPTDTRFFFSFGKFDEMKPGDTLKISVALVGGYGIEAGPHNLRENAENALKLYKRGYLAPINLPAPPLKVTEGFKKVRLEWGSHLDTAHLLDNPQTIWDDSSKIAQGYPDTSWRRKNPPCQIPGACESGHLCINGYLTGGRIFEGYRLYRSEDPGNDAGTASWTLLRQYDIPDDKFEYNVGLDSVFVDSNLTRGKRYWYAVTSFGIPDLTIIEVKDSSGALRFDSLYAQNTESPKSNKTRVDLSFSVSDTLGKVIVVPNPYRVDRDYTYETGGWEGRASGWSENNRLVKFIHLPQKCTIRIFTLAGDQVTTLDHNDPVRGELEWNLLSQSGRALASGVYIFTVESN
ncbi:MAG TPA: hypothetical protein VES59_04735, partial [Bacteroidota bacterium]|nr:hypothetical protein [Bacteroidota bacterium]